MYEFAEKLSKKGMRVPDLAMAGGFSSEDGGTRRWQWVPILQGCMYVEGIDDTRVRG
jgi:hypothetical protein